MFKYRKYLPPGTVIIEQIDEKFLAAQASIALKAYEKSGNPNSGALGNLVGIAGEYAFDGFLEYLDLKEGTDYEWHKRTIDHGQEGVDERPYDFKLLNESGITFEIGTARPHHSFAIVKDSKHKKESKYFVQVKMLSLGFWYAIPWHGKNSWLLFDLSLPEAKELDFKDLESFKPPKKDNNAIGQAVIKGFDETAKIIACENNWKYGRKGNFPTTDANGWYKPIDSLTPLEDLEKIIEDSLNKNKGPNDKGTQSKLW